MQVRDIHSILRSLYIDRIAYFDRIHIWLDTNRNVIDTKTQEAIESAGSNFEIILKPMSVFRPSWRQKIELLQIPKPNLELVANAIYQSTCGYHISHVELTVDWIARNWSDAQTLHRHFEQSFIHLAGDSYFFQNDYRTQKRNGTAYFADQKNRGIIPLLYSDRRKISVKPCAHFEYKLASTEACKRKGIRTLQHLLDLDIVDFMVDNVTFDKKPAKHKVGAAIARLENRSISSVRGYEKRCDEFLKEKVLSYDSVTLQQLLSLLPDLREGLDARNSSYHKAMVKALFA